MLMFNRSCWSLALVLGVLLSSATAWADDDDHRGHHDLTTKECERVNQMKAPTVDGGTGLFNTYSTRTLHRGEFSVGLFWNNYDRDPGDIDINQIKANVTGGFAHNWEVW